MFVCKNLHKIIVCKSELFVCLVFTFLCFTSYGDVTIFARELQSLTYTRHSKPTICVNGHTFIRLSPTNRGCTFVSGTVRTCMKDVCLDIATVRVCNDKALPFKPLTTLIVTVAPNIWVRGSYARVNLGQNKNVK